jgi:tRNA pseudouridine38-40 synthase
MRTIRLTLEYAGTRFHGWQRQPGLRTVQGEIEAALRTVLREPVALHGAGRTDAGVHALGQVASFRCEGPLSLERIRGGVEALTGDDLTVRGIEEAPEGFDARHSARARHYVYLLLDRRSALWWDRAVLTRVRPDPELLNAAAARLVGDHDFAGFSCATADEKGTGSRVFYAVWAPWTRGLAFRIGAVRYLHKMVRCIVGGSLELARGRMGLDAFEARLTRPERRGEPVAPAAGLYLASVDYDPAPSWGPDCLPPWPML